jgi:hypothetical protein
MSTIVVLLVVVVLIFSLRRRCGCLCGFDLVYLLQNHHRIPPKKIHMIIILLRLSQYQRRGGDSPLPTLSHCFRARKFFCCVASIGHTPSKQICTFFYHCVFCFIYILRRLEQRRQHTEKNALLLPNLQAAAICRCSAVDGDFHVRLGRIFVVVLIVGGGGAQRGYDRHDRCCCCYCC